MVRLWETETGELLQTLRAFTSRGPSPMCDLAFSPDGRYILSSGSLDGIVRLWETETGKSLQELKAVYSSNDEYLGNVCSSVFSPTGKYIIAGMYNGTVKLYETESGNMLREMQGPSSGVFAIAFSTNGENIILGSKNIKLLKIMLNNTICNK
jgi:WD40 repeat protein